MNLPPDPDRALLDAALASQRILSLLDTTARARLREALRIREIAAGECVATAETLHDRLGLLLAGELALHLPSAGRAVALQVGELFGCGITPRQDGLAWQVLASRPSRVAWLAAAEVQALCSEHPVLSGWLDAGAARAPTGVAAAPVRADAAAGSTEPGLLATPVRALLKRVPVCVSPQASIRSAAQLMSQQRVSSVLLVEQDRLLGLVTDRDLRNRAVAQGIDIDRPVREIATLAPITIEQQHPAFEALLLMARRNIHHVPVVDGGRVAGMITATDLAEQSSASAVHLVREIGKQDEVEGLRELSTRIRALQQGLAAAQTSAYATGHLVTTITDALTRRLLQLGEARLGQPPIDYVWVAAGSQARNEQTARSDQDNCMVLDDAYDSARHGEYFRDLSRFVCDGLDACGYVHCPGEMMAMTDAWRQPRARWAEYFRAWVDEPDPKALMLTCVFFDLRAVHGRSELLAELRREVLQRTQANSIFLAYMVSNALGHHPPLGLFGQISTDKGGTIDLKHAGVVPVVDLARVYALAGGFEAVNTHDRLLQAAESHEISPQSAHDLRDALEFLASLRIQHQARQLARGLAADNLLRPAELSNFERHQLKDAFGVVRTLQSVLSRRYQAGRF